MRLSYRRLLPTLLVLAVALFALACDRGAINSTNIQADSAAAEPTTHGAPKARSAVDFSQVPAERVEPQLKLSEAQWKDRLSAAQYNVLRENGTERPFSGALLNNQGEGVYTCGGCGEPLFSSETKFKSGTGWPSFYDRIEDGSVALVQDASLGVERVEVYCGNCGGHLGHVFNDGPAPTGLRYCMNSDALGFEAD